MTTIALPERLKYGGTTPPNGSRDLADYTQQVYSLSGFDDAPELRGSNAPLTGLHGSTFLRKLYGPRRPSGSIVVGPTSTTGATHGSGDRVGYRENLDALQAILGRRDALQVLSRLMPDGTTRWLLAESLGLSGILPRVGGRVATAMVAWEAPDPFWYGAIVTDSSRVFSSSPLNWSLTIAGSVDTRRVLLDVLGPCTGFRFTNNTTGHWIEATGIVVASTKHLLIDPYAMTALNDGVDVSAALSIAGVAEPMLFEPGSNSLTATGTGLSAATRLSTSHYPAWL